MRRRVLSGSRRMDESMPVYSATSIMPEMREAGIATSWNPKGCPLSHRICDPRRPQPEDRRDLERFQSRWRHVIAHDPYYNPNLILSAMIVAGGHAAGDAACVVGPFDRMRRPVAAVSRLDTVMKKHLWRIPHRIRPDANSCGKPSARMAIPSRISWTEGSQTRRIGSCHRQHPRPFRPGFGCDTGRERRL